MEEEWVNGETCFPQNFHFKEERRRTIEDKRSQSSFGIKGPESQVFMVILSNQMFCLLGKKKSTEDHEQPYIRGDHTQEREL